MLHWAGKIINKVFFKTIRFGKLFWNCFWNPLIRFLKINKIYFALKCSYSIQQPNYNFHYFFLPAIGVAYKIHNQFWKWERILNGLCWENVAFIKFSEIITIFPSIPNTQHNRFGILKIFRIFGERKEPHIIYFKEKYQQLILILEYIPISEKILDWLKNNINFTHSKFTNFFQQLLELECFKD